MNHFYQKIQGWFTFSKLYDFMLSECPDPGHIVEIGCWKGRSTAYMAVEIINSGKSIKFDVIDPFIALDTATCGALPISSADLKAEFIQNMKPVEAHYNLIHAYSPAPAKNYPDNSIDAIFIDGDHSYNAVSADIQAWMPKVKINGILAGHDYATFLDVRRACNVILGGNNWADPWACLSWIARKTEKGFIKI